MVVAPLFPPPSLPRYSPESVRGWRHQSRAEHDAGLTTNQPTLLLAFFTCDLCTICIGPDFYEQELFLYPVYQQEVCLGDKPMYFAEWTYLKICGGCAHAKRRRLPPLYRAIQARFWTTNELLLEENTDETPQPVSLTNDIQVARIRQALHRQVLAVARFLLFLYCLDHHLPLSLLFVTEPAHASSSSKEKGAAKGIATSIHRVGQKRQDHVKQRKQTSNEGILSSPSSPFALPFLLPAHTLPSPSPFPLHHEAQFSTRFRDAVSPLTFHPPPSPISSGIGAVSTSSPS